MDRVIAASKTIDGNNVYLFAVSDGVGSLTDGGFASELAANMLHEWIDALESVSRIGLELQKRIMEINTSVIFLASINNIETAATLSVLLLCGERYYIVHIGDSRIYSFDGERLSQLTEDHSFEGRLSSAIGRKQNPTVFYDEGVNDGFTYLVCSDGLYRKMNEAFLLDILTKTNKKNITKRALELVNHVIDLGEQDNTSIILAINER